MPFIKDPYALLAEAASMDLQQNTEGSFTESQIISRLNSFEEATEDIIITAEMVSVLQIKNKYVVEMNTLLPYMKTNNIKSVEEALNNVAFANQLQEKSVGLLIESNDYMMNMLEKADIKFKKDGNKLAKNKVLDKIKKATDLPNKLKKDGFPVIKKKSTSKDEGCCKECESNKC